MPEGPANWFEDEDLWESTFPFMFPERVFDAATEQVAKILAKSRTSEGAVLDLCCGPGRHSVAFAKAGFAVTGVDRTKYLLDKARSYSTAEGVDVEWVQDDMRSFVREKSFDLAVNLYTSFGYFDTHEDNIKVLNNVLVSLKSGGMFILDVMGKEVLARIFEATGSSDLEGGGVLFQRRRAIDDWSRMENEWTLLADGNATSFHFRHWIYSGRELREMLEECGFDSVSLYGDLDWTSYGPAAQRLVAVARKD